MERQKQRKLMKLCSAFIITIIFAFTAWVIIATAQQSIYLWRVSNAVNATGSTNFYSTGGLNATYASLVWTTVGTLNSCSIQVNYSTNGTSVAGQLISAQNCVSSGSIIAGSTSSPAYIQIAYTIGTGGGYIQFGAEGCINSTCLATPSGSVPSGGNTAMFLVGPGSSPAWANSLGGTLNITTGCYEINSTCLASTNLTDTGNLAYLGSSNIFTSGLSLSSSGSFNFSNSTASPSVQIRAEQLAANFYAADNSGSSTAYTVPLSPAIKAYATGMFFCFKAETQNSTTTPTVNVNSIGAITIVKFNAAPVTVGDISTSEPVCLVYDGTDFVLLNPQLTSGSGGLARTNSPTFAGIGNSGSYSNNTTLLFNATAPTVSSGFGTTPSIANNNGPASFTVNVGTGGTASSGVIGLPTASHGWTCSCTDITTQSTSVFQCKQTGVGTTSATVTNYNDAAVATAWTASDILQVSCLAY